MRSQAVPILMATLVFCSADRSWGRGNAAPGPNTVSGINAAKALLDQYNAMHGGTPTSSQVTTPASSQVTSPASSQVTSPASTRAPATCYTKQQDVGACVKTSMCDLAPPKINPATLFGYRTRKTSANGCAFLEICCPNDKIRPTPVPPPTGTSGGTPPGCGYSNPAAARFRQGPGASNSGYADFAEFPWMVALLDKTKANQNSANAAANSGYMAGGTLIHPSVVMTVAHKVDTLNPSDLVCRAGEWDTESDNEVYTHQERDVIDIIPHEQFNKLHAHNDIALLKLATPFVFQPHISVACLSPAMPPSETMCYSMGWGMDFTKGKYYANVLKKVPLGLISSVECEERLRQTRLSRSYYLHHSLTCAGGLLNVDTCIGDGGSSLVCPIGDPADRRYTVVGMVAYGLDCGQAGVPSVYTKVPEFYNWISNQLAIEGLSGRPYVS
ncbi:phenoloxidase-activating factor 2-like isoform X2 [Maniola jurtina]|uniref:phenoloxidase-activating factor 2-like isoform X1 n=1 Tax=Maniola jurtina TaxID=191418 RepID=UPI001E687255|nr:phenoloxidase-activating factor 2-like isoform X1 [Maniola jurtina]XP_045781882.1 phenoloxidase-activating factor 2-like isoform X2 [Maniola jurtina]